MNEDFLHFVWQHHLFQPDKLETKDGQSLEIIHPGLKNIDSGPDFFNAKIKLNGTLWAGNIEIHKDEMDWYRHGHQDDETYNNVILHVVDKTKGETLTSKGRSVPVWKIKYSKTLTDRYQSLFFNKKWIACEDHLKDIDPIVMTQWIERMLIERLEEKSELINHLLDAENNDWDQVFFIILSRSFGFGLNALPFELLAKQTPLKILLKHSDQLFQLEAILFGQAGWLKSPSKTDDYIRSLQKEYHFLSEKYKLIPIESHLWKFLRLRPSNFPTIRLAQLAKVINISKGLFEKLHSGVDNKYVQHILDVKASEYWDNHYQFGTTSSRKSTKHLGSLSQQIIIYNTIFPYLFVYHTKNNNQIKKEKIIDALYNQPAEKNSITMKWEQAGVKIENEAQAQALIFLKNHYCNHKKCLNCRIGHKVLTKRE